MTKPQARERLQVAHITVETCVERDGCVTYALFAGFDQTKSVNKALFTGVLEKGMGTAFRRLAHHFDDLERRAEGGK